MRRYIIAAAVAAALTASLSMIASRAEAMPMPAGVAAQTSVEEVALVCRRVWNGFRFVQECVRRGPVFVAPVVRPRPYYGPRRHEHRRHY